MPNGGYRSMDPDELGEFVLQLVDSQQRWIARRVETLTLIDAKTIERDTTFQIWLIGSPPSAFDGVVPLPLFRLDRQFHTAFRVATDDDRDLAFATYEEERDFVARGILRRAPTLASRSDVSEWVQSVVRSNQTTKLESLLSAGRSLIPATCPHGEVVETLAAITLYLRSFLLIVYVPAERFASPFVLRAKYLDPIPHENPWRFGKIAGGTISWSTKIPLPSVGKAESYHVNIVAPDGLRMVDCSMIVEDSSGAEHVVYDDDRLPTTAHMLWRRSLGEADVANAAISVYANKTGLLSDAAGASLVVLCLLLVFTRQLRHVGFNMATFNASYVAAVLLLMPVLIVAAITYRDSSRIASQAFALTKLNLYVQAASLLLGSLPFVFGLAPSRAAPLWYAAATLGVLTCLRQLLVTVRHLWKISDKRARKVTKKRSPQVSSSDQNRYDAP